MAFLAEVTGIHRFARPLAWVALLTIAGCGGSAGAVGKATPTARPTTAPTSTATPFVVYFTATPIPPSPTATIGETETPTPTVAPTRPPAPQVQSATVRPLNARPGQTLTVTVVTSGAIGRVQVYLGSGSPSGPPPSAYNLQLASTGTWTTSFGAPAVGGIYHYTVGIFVHGRRTIVDNDGWNITVGSAQPTPAPTVVLTFPDDIPLVPPFSYGNAVPATFSAEGQSISGLEVSSNVRPDVAAANVAQFYEVRLPRAGWTVDKTSIPAAGATNFDIVATAAGATGTRVVVVSYAAATVHIFYGTLGR